MVKKTTEKNTFIIGQKNAGLFTLVLQKSTIYFVPSFYGKRILFVSGDNDIVAKMRRRRHSLVIFVDEDRK